MPVILNVALLIIGLWIMYMIIRSAIDGSQTAEDIREIRKILSKQYPVIDDNEKHIPEENKENNVIEEIPVEECPACHSKVSSADRKCPSCGLALVLEDDNF